MSPAVNAKSVTRNVGWSVLSKTGTFGLKFVTVPILARILSPEEFGAVAVALALVQFLAMIGGAGFASGLVIQPDEDMETVHSVFWTNLAISLGMALFVFLTADQLAALLGAPEAGDLLRIMSPLIPLQLTGDVAYALLARRMQFSQDALWSMISEAAGALIAVALALLGFGVWALVAQLFSSALIRLAGLYAVSRYMPRFVLRPRKVLVLGRFSVSMMGSEIANFITFQSPMVIISRYLGLADAGAYSAANRFASIPNQVVLSAVMGVLFPAFSSMMQDRERRLQALVLSTQVTTVLLAPMMFGLWALAEPGMLVLFGPQWAHAWPVLALLSLSKGILTPCSTYIPYLKGIGRGGMLFWWAVIRAIATTGAVAYAAIHGSLTDAMIALCIVNAIVLVGYSWVVHQGDRAPLTGFLLAGRPMASAIAMALVLRYLLNDYGHLLPNPLLQLVVGIGIGGVLYGALTLLLERRLLKKMTELFRKRTVAPTESSGS
ncbi:lipopolysaccharide biosynthesis protein [Rhizobium sp. AQ_MP]|uniref:lipopolysaccharide biosynthesis protein n=1 Tax=Rhizobium sp. AQ_MP TaxID=2761536 RepID=UPI001639AB6C|nr:lipopolysaccharide biosynthesis protein [Rhizobium sp. AQ_MP]MBC2773154.1 lipopolysaccharide biosynthesis protein [Rhizobium sp. AQ_MP]